MLLNSYHYFHYHCYQCLNYHFQTIEVFPQNSDEIKKCDGFQRTIIRYFAIDLGSNSNNGEESFNTRVKDGIGIDDFFVKGGDDNNVIDVDNDDEDKGDGQGERN